MEWRARASALVACGLLAGLLLACSSLPANPEWKGKNIAEAIKEYGPPTRVTDTGLGKTYTWEQRREMTGFGGVPGGTREVRVTLRMMTVDANGIITSYNRVDQ